MTVPKAVTDVRAVRVRSGSRAELPDVVTTEEPMEIRVAGPGQRPEPVAVTMRTPGHDFELAAGFLCTEGLAAGADIAAVGYCDDVVDANDRFNTVTVALRRPWEPPAPARTFVAGSSCGICGKASIDAVQVACDVVAPAAPFPASLVASLPDRLRDAQAGFDRTGGIHASALFDQSGSLVAAREDVGRHNAVDKVVGHLILARVPGPRAGWVVMVSGRVSFEIVQKAAMAGIGTVAAISAPSSLALDAARRLGLAVVAFVRGETFNVYTHPERLDFDR